MQQTESTPGAGEPARDTAVAGEQALVFETGVVQVASPGLADGGTIDTVQALRDAWARYWPAVAAGTLALLLFAFAVGRGYNHDEEQYVAAGVLAMQADLYKDFLYLQTPYYPKLLAAVFAVFSPDGGYFHAARLLNLGFTLMACGVLWAVGRHLTGSHGVGLGTALLFATSTAILPGIDSTRNDMAPCAVALLGVALVLRAADGHRRSDLMLGGAGALFAIAVGLKLSYFFVPACVMFYVLVGLNDRPLAARIRGVALPLAVGGALGGLPILGWAAADWEAFVEGVYTYHRETPALWHAAIGRSHYFGMEHLAEFLNHRVLSDSTVACLILMACTLVASRTGLMARSVRERLRATRAPLVLWLTALALVFAFLPRPPYIQYFHPFGAFLALSVPFLFHALKPLGQARKVVFTAAVLVGCFPGTILLVQNGARLFNPDKWMVNRVEQAGEGILVAMAVERAQGPVLTLSPIFALEAGLEIYPELAAGPFFYRTADRLSAAALGRLNAVSPQTVDALMRREPPAAILVGKQPEFLERPLIDYARRNGFVEYPVPRFKDLRLYVRPRSGR